MFHNDEVWSYVVFGDNYERYYLPLVHNISLAKQVGAKIIISIQYKDYYMIKDKSEWFQKHVMIIICSSPNSKKYPKLERVLNVQDVTSEYIFFKDSDSIVTKQELTIHKEWKEKSTQYPYLIIRNHPEHVAPIMAGMFAVQLKKLPLLQSLINLSLTNQNMLIKLSSYAYDQQILARYVYPEIVSYSAVYTSHFAFVNEHVFLLQHCVKNHIGSYFLEEEAKHNVLSSLINFCYRGGLLYSPFFHKYPQLHQKTVPSILIARVYTFFISLRRFFCEHK